MNMRNPVLMQSWKQFGKMMIMMSFVGVQILKKTMDGKIVFLTQAESYHHCGPVFAHYSQLEFKGIVKLQQLSLNDNVFVFRPIL